MIEETAIIIKCEGDVAWVETQRQSTCSRCHAKNACGTSVLSKWLGSKAARVRALNRIHAREGETVTVGLQEAALLKSSFMVYFLPLLVMLLFAITGKLLANQIHWPAEPVVIVFAVSGLGISALLVRRFSARIQSDQRYQPVILRRKQANLI